MTERLKYLREFYPFNMLGVDVSRWQGYIDWDKMKSRGVEFAVIRNTVGDYYLDPMTNFYYQSCLKRGIYSSFYHVMRTQATAQDQMDWYFSQQPSRPDFPIILDLEWEKIAENTVFFDPERTTERFLECAEIIKVRDGRNPIMYSAPYYLWDFVNYKELLKFPLWIAHYGVNYPGQSGSRNLLEEMGFKSWAFWQCMADGDNQGEYFGSGAAGLDVNFYKGTKEEFEKKYISLPVKVKARIRSLMRRIRPR